MMLRRAELEDSSDGDTDPSKEAAHKQRMKLARLGLVADDVDALDQLNVLNLDLEQSVELCMWMVYGDAMLLGGFVEDSLKLSEGQMFHFFKQLSFHYNSHVKYHIWYHGVDVMHSVYRMMDVCQLNPILEPQERFAMLVAAAGHDVGHFGVNNGFLAETNHPLSLMYSDQSPLEMMHCYILFQLAYTNPATAILRNCSRSLYMEIRKVITDGILATDMNKHFEMVAQLTHLTGENERMLEAFAFLYRNRPAVGSSSKRGGEGPNRRSSSFGGGGGGRGQFGTNLGGWDLPEFIVNFWVQPKNHTLLRLSFILNFVACICNDRFF